MSETKTISVFTDLIVNGNDIQIKTEYEEIDTLPDTIEAFLADYVGVKNGISFIEGEGLITMKNSPEHISFIIDSDGNLILTCNTGDQDKYSINTDGNLIYTTTE